jgi:hypothetical protein
MCKDDEDDASCDFLVLQRTDIKDSNFNLKSEIDDDIDDIDDIDDDDESDEG